MPSDVQKPRQPGGPKTLQTRVEPPSRSQSDESLVRKKDIKNGPENLNKKFRSTGARSNFNWTSEKPRAYYSLATEEMDVKTDATTKVNRKFGCSSRANQHFCSAGTSIFGNSNIIQDLKTETSGCTNDILAFIVIHQ